MSNIIWLIAIAVVGFILWQHFKGDDTAKPSANTPLTPGKKNVMVSPTKAVNPITAQFSWLGKIF